MKPWLKRTLAGLFGASVLFGGLAACSHRAEYGMGGWGRHTMSEADAAKARERMIERVSSRLNLDEAQRAKLGALATVMREQRMALMGGSEPRAELQGLVAGGTFDRSKAQALIEAKTTAVKSGSPAVIAALGDFYDSLRPEQQQQVRDFMARGRQGWRH